MEVGIEELNRNKQDEVARKLRREKNASQAMRIGGEMAKIGGKTGQVASNALDKSGKGMMSAGRAMSSSGLGAVVGVPMMAAGGLMQGVGKVGGVASQGVEKVGDVSSRAGRLRQMGSRRKALIMKTLPPQAKTAFMLVDSEAGRKFRKVIMGIAIIQFLIVVGVVLAGGYVILDKWLMFKFYWLS